jgi:hypothetical protein
LWRIDREPEDKSMTCIVFPLLLGLSLAPSFCWAAEPNTDEGKVVAEIEKLGGKVTRDEASPGKPVIAVDLKGSTVTDAGLAYLAGLKRLQSLNLANTKVTEAGLAHLKGLTELQSLSLYATKVTGPGLVNLKGMTHLQSLNLMYTPVADAGLVYVKDLTQLQSLDLSGYNLTDAGLVSLHGLIELRYLRLERGPKTKITEAGISALQKALPKCKINAAGISRA